MSVFGRKCMGDKSVDKDIACLDGKLCVIER